MLFLRSSSKTLARCLPIGKAHLLVILVVLVDNGGTFIWSNERTNEWMSRVTQRHYPHSFFSRFTVNVFPLSPRFSFSRVFFESPNERNSLLFLSPLSLSLASSRCFSRSNLRTPPHLLSRSHRHTHPDTSFQLHNCTSLGGLQQHEISKTISPIYWKSDLSWWSDIWKMINLC